MAISLNSIKDMTERMERLTQVKNAQGSASEILVMALMVIASNMPSRPRGEIAKLLDTYDRVPK